MYGRQQSCPQPTAQRDFNHLSLPTPADSKGCAPNPQLCAEKTHSTKKKTYPERVKKKGCCQDQRKVGSHGGERARGPRAEAGAEAGQARDSSPGLERNSRLWVWLLSTSLLALRECAAALLRLSQALPTAGERCARHQGAVSDPSSRARTRIHTHLKQYSSLIRRRTAGVRQRFAV